MRVAASILVLAILAPACTRDQAEAAVNQDLADAAYDLCPIMWRWQLGMGQIMNDMSQAAYEEPSPETRLDIYLEAMDTARDQLDYLRSELAGLPDDRFQQFFRGEIEAGLVQAEAAIDDAEANLRERHRSAALPPTYHDVVPPLFLSFEKVIDLAKPELASYGDPELIPAFQTVAQCQHGVKDADDGVPRYVPLTPEPRS